MAHGILPSSEAWRLQNMASVEDEAIRHMDQSAIKEGASMLPLRDDDNVERPRWLSGCSGKDPSPAVARHVKFCGCEPLSECLHSVHHYIPAMEVSQSSALPSCVAIPFSALRGVPQQHFYQGIPTTGVSGDAANRTSSGSSGATSSQEPSQPLFVPLQYPKGTLHDIYTSGSCNNNAGDARSHIFQELSQYDFLQNAKLKADIVFHPLYDQLLAAHVACLRVATPVDNLQTLEAQIANRRNLAAKYAMVARNAPLASQEKRELDHFMASYLLLLQSFKDQLQEHVRMHAMEAVAVCWEIEQAFINLTGVSAGEGSGATMSDDENEDEDTGFPFFDPMVLDGHDSLGYGPLIPTETERSLMERVRQELKLELKQGFRTRIADVREEILRKRRAGKLPGETTSALKTWWKAHSKWPYPTEDEKARLVQETGLELKQINNWFINQRKRNWHSAPNSSFGKPKSDASTDGQPSHISLSLGPDQSLPPTDQHLPQEANSSWASQRLPGPEKI